MSTREAACARLAVAGVLAFAAMCLAA